MSKQQSFFSKVIRRAKEDEGFRWEPSYLEWLAKMRDSVQLDIRCPYRELAGTKVMSLQQESFVRALDERRIELEHADDAYVYPGLSIAWETAPVAVELGGRLVRRFCGDSGQGDPILAQTPLRALDRLLPSCLLIDARKLGFSLHSVDLEALFVYPSYDIERGYAILLLVGMSLDNGLRFPLQSKLVLKGETFADAVAASDEERAFLASMWWAEGGEEGLVEIFSPLDDDAELMRFAARLLARLCSDETRLSRYEAPLWTCIDANIPKEQQQRPHKAAEEPGKPAEVAPVAQSAAATSLSSDENMAGHPENAAVDIKQGADRPKGEAEPEDAAVADDTADKRIAELETTVASMQARISSLNYSLELAHITGAELRQELEAQRTKAQLIDELEIPATPLEALALAQKAFADRLVFLPSASKSAAAFKDGDAAETWAVLRAMAMTLLPLCSSGKGGDIASRFQDKTGFELALRDTKATKDNAKLQRLRRFEYKGTKRDASAHVKGRDSKSGKRLRVHFFYDSDEQKLVIAHCGNHLRSASTAKR